MTELERHLGELDGMAAALAALLSDERDALGSRDVASIERLAAEKEILCQHIDRQLIALESTVADAGYENRAALLCEEQGLSAIWQRVMAALGQCREMNRANGRIVDGARALNRRLLEMFTGASPAPPTYGAHGQVRHAAFTAPIARA